jgi:hypothetical protein
MGIGRIEGMTEPKQMLFGVPHFHEGLNVTVRDGRKWFEELKSGDVVHALRAKDRMFFRELRVVLAVHCPDLASVPEFLLEFEHDEGCRTRNGLFEELHRVYGGNARPWGRDGLTVVLLWANDASSRNGLFQVKGLE